MEASKRKSPSVTALTGTNHRLCYQDKQLTAALLLGL